MSLFTAPSWDVDAKCEELNTQLFGPSKSLQESNDAKSPHKVSPKKKKKDKINVSSVKETFRRKKNKFKQYDYKPISAESSPANLLTDDSTVVQNHVDSNISQTATKKKERSLKKKKKKTRTSVSSVGSVNNSDLENSTHIERDRKYYVLAPRLLALADKKGKKKKKKKKKREDSVSQSHNFVSEPESSFSQSVGDIDDSYHLEEKSLIHAKLKLKDRVKPPRSFSFQIKKSNVVTPNETLTKVLPRKVIGNVPGNVVTVTPGITYDKSEDNDSFQSSGVCKSTTRKHVQSASVENSISTPVLPSRKRKRYDENDTVIKETPDVHNLQYDPGRNSMRKKGPFNFNRLREFLGKSSPGTDKEVEESPSAKPKKKELLPLRERMMARLHAAHFRHVNEQMYTCKGKDSLDYFKKNPGSFEAYHEGYQLQVSQWPVNPLELVIKSLKKKSKDLVIADFGCGDAKLAKSLPNKVHSFDLVSLDDVVTVCDMAHTPLPDAAVDVAVFCLSLMGTDLADYLIEANRVLKIGGLLKIVEVESRFKDVTVFIKNLNHYGFTNTWKDFSHNLFYLMDFKKERDIKGKKKLPPLELKPCLYKKR